MCGDERVIGILNEVLTNELTATNQYYLHYAMQKNWPALLAQGRKSERVHHLGSSIWRATATSNRRVGQLD